MIRLENRVTRLEYLLSGTRTDLERIEDIAKNNAHILVLFGSFCALWAQNTGRSPWLWFFMGLFLHVITVLVLLAKNEPTNT